MVKVIRVDLENLRFYSYHGFYPEEQILGNEYEVTIKTSFDGNFLNEENLDDHLEKSVNYEKLYAIVQKSMNRPRKLLETVANEILNTIQAEFTLLEKIEISICKINPPFGGDKARANVSI